MTGVSWKGRGRCREVNHPEPFLMKRPTPPEEGNGGDYNLKGMLLFRGLLRRTCVLLAMTRVSWKGRGRCREVNHPEPFLMKRPTPPQEGNGGDYNLKGALPLRGLLCRSRVLLAMTDVRLKSRAHCR